jgi:hypothetical protein
MPPVEPGLHALHGKARADGGHGMRLIALFGVGALALFLLIRHSNSGGQSSSASLQNAADQAAAAQQAQDQATGAYGAPSTFADNGAQAAALGDAVTQGLGGVADALNTLQGSVNATASNPDASTGGQAGPAGPAGPTGKPGPQGKPGPRGKPAPVPKPKPKAKPQVVGNHGGAHHPAHGGHVPKHTKKPAPKPAPKPKPRGKR